MKHVAFRLNASATIGVGHLSRCMTLAKSLKDRTGTEITFFCNDDLPEYLANRIQENYALIPVPRNISGNEETDAAFTLATLERMRSPDWIVVDSYDLGIRWEQDVMSSAAKIMVIDDLERTHQCHLYLNQNLLSQNQSEQEGQLSEDCERLRGPQFALLRTEFRAAYRNREVRNTLLICFGGGDPTNETEKALHALQSLTLQDLNVEVIVGGANPQSEKLKDICAKKQGVTLTIEAKNIEQVMSRSSFAICAGGSTTWEMCCMGVPMIIISLAANQTPIAQAIAQKGAALYLGESSQVTVSAIATAIKEMSSNQHRLEKMQTVCRSLVDGKGSDRVTERMVALR